MENHKKTEPFFYMAPIRGITEADFRNIFHHHFGGCDAAIAPFINPQRFANFKEKHLTDLLPKNNPLLPVVPQLLHTDADDFLALSDRLGDLGYEHVNWNLGCPAPTVTKKKRGSGLLPHTDTILSFMERVLPRLQGNLSIKTRLGYADRNELFTLLPLLNDFPLKEIIIHTRLGNQLYRGNTDLEGFSICQKLSRHTLVYNGDITDMESFRNLQNSFPEIQRWMLGRGLLSDPFLASTLKGIHTSSDTDRKRLKEFHHDLYTCYSTKLFGPSHILGRMKQIWAYLIHSFPDRQHLWKKIKKVRTEVQYEKVIEELFGE